MPLQQVWNTRGLFQAACDREAQPLNCQELIAATSDNRLIEKPCCQIRQDDSDQKFVQIRRCQLHCQIRRPRDVARFGRPQRRRLWHTRCALG